MSEIMSAGIALMVIGMTVVFVFLTLLIVITHGMARIVQRFFAEQPVATTASDANLIDTHTVAAISAALHQHRSNRN